MIRPGHRTCGMSITQCDCAGKREAGDYRSRIMGAAERRLIQMRHPDVNEILMKTSLGEEVWNVLELKARLWTNGDKDALLRRAVMAYQEPIRLMESVHCSRCGNVAH